MLLRILLERQPFKLSALYGTFTLEAKNNTITKKWQFIPMSQTQIVKIIPIRPHILEKYSIVGQVLLILRDKNQNDSFCTEPK